MQKITINDKSYNIPTSYDELTLGEYCEIFYNLEDIDKIEDETERKKESIKRQSVILSRILKEKDDFALELPITLYSRLFDMAKWIYDDLGQYQTQAINQLEVNGTKYSIKEVNKLSTRQYIDIDILIKEQKTNKNMYCDILAIIIQDNYNGEYQTLSESIRNIPCNKALPIVFFSFIANKNSQASFQVYSKLREIQNHLHKKLENLTKNIGG